MTGYEKVFLDTAPLIYFLDNDEHFGEKTRMIFEEVLSVEKTLITSSVACMEYLVLPYRINSRQKISAFFDFTNDCGIEILRIDTEIAKAAARIRASYPDFKAMDALQLATAVCNGCDVFLTNDKQLRQFTEVRCITVDEWILRDVN